MKVPSTLIFLRLFSPQRSGPVTEKARTRPRLLTPLQAAEPRLPAKAEWSSGESSDIRMREGAEGMRCASGGQGLQFVPAASSAGPGIQKSPSKHLQIESNPLLPSHVALAGNFVFCASPSSTVRWGQQFKPGYRWSYGPCKGPAQCLTQMGPHQQASPPLPLKAHSHSSWLRNGTPWSLPSFSRGGLPQEWDGDRGQRRDCACQHTGKQLGLMGAVCFSLFPYRGPAKPWRGR